MTEPKAITSTETRSDLTEAPIRVLNVDDDLNFLNITKQILEMFGTFQVDTASSVDDAMKKLKEKTYDAVVSDYYMPGKDGLEFLKELRASGNDIPFVIFTGKSRETIAIQAVNLGADRYFNKMGDPETVYGELVHGIRKVVERRNVDREVWKRGERLRAILASSPDIITVSDLQGNIVDCNEAAWKLSGFSSKEELLGKSSFEFIAEKDRKRALENLKKTFQEGTTRNIEYTLIRKDGEEYAGELSASILNDSSGYPTGFVGVVRDITERKKVVREIRIKDSAIGSSINAIALADLEGNLTYVNPSFLEMWGYDDDKEVLGSSVASFSLRSEDALKVVKALEIEGGWSGELTARKKNGSPFEVQLSANRVPNEAGKPICMMASFIDITDRKKIFRKLEILNEKLAVVGGLTRHDVNNKLATVRANVYLAKKELTGDRPALKHLNEIDSAVEQAKQIFDFARIYERLGVEALQYVTVEDAVEEARKQFSDLNVMVVNECRGLRVLADSMLSRLFYNHIDNSLKHGENVTKIRVYYEESKDTLQLVYEDDGVGIPQEEKEKIFEQGYGKGTGLGLYLIMKICEVYGWTIKETGKLNKGARFIMTLPKMNWDEGKTGYLLKK